MDVFDPNSPDAPRECNYKSRGSLASFQTEEEYQFVRGGSMSLEHEYVRFTTVLLLGSDLMI